MIPSAGQLAQQIRFAARGVHVDVEPPAAEVARAAALALQLAAGAIRDEPAALFYAFVRVPRAAPAAATRVAALLALRLAAGLGPAPRFTLSEAETLFVRAVAAPRSFADVRAWFAARLASAPS